MSTPALRFLADEGCDLLPYYFDDTRLSQTWMEFGCEILRGAEPRISSSNRSRFEDRLITQDALTEFGSTMSYIDAIEEPTARLQILLAVVQALDQQLMRAKHSEQR